MCEHAIELFARFLSDDKLTVSDYEIIWGKIVYFTLREFYFLENENVLEIHIDFQRNGKLS